MKTRLLCIAVLIPCVIAVGVVGCTPGQQRENASQALNIQGTYTLISRQLPDGTVQAPPDVMGLITYTKEYRNFNIVWKDAEGKLLSISYVATYTLAPTEYSEKSIYHMVNDEISGEGINYDFSGQSGTSSVMVEDGRIQFQLPLYNEPSVVFEKGKLTATTTDFVDVWEKVE